MIREAAVQAGHVAELVLGFVQTTASFHTTMCSGAVEYAKQLGLTIATANGSDLVYTVERLPEIDAAEAVEYLAQPPAVSYKATSTSVVYAAAALKAAGANVLVGCTYDSTTTRIVEALEHVDFSPRATIVSASLGLDAYNTRVDQGWWQGEYVAGPTPWHVSANRTGAYSKISSEQFAEIYKDRTGDDVGYQGAAAFGSAAALASAIEAAGTLDTELVRQALQAASYAQGKACMAGKPTPAGPASWPGLAAPKEPLQVYPLAPAEPDRHHSA